MAAMRRVASTAPQAGRVSACHSGEVCPAASGFGDQRFDHIAVFAVRHDQHAVVFGDSQSAENTAIVEAQASVVGGEDFQGVMPISTSDGSSAASLSK